MIKAIAALILTGEIMGKVNCYLSMPVKEKSVKSTLAEYDAAFIAFRESQAAKVPESFQKDYRLGCDYSRQYATVIPRNYWFDKGYADGRAFGKSWFDKSR